MNILCKEVLYLGHVISEGGGVCKRSSQRMAGTLFMSVNDGLSLVFLGITDASSPEKVDRERHCNDME